jgi:hypothetical protein
VVRSLVAWLLSPVVDGSVTNEWWAGDEDFGTTSGIGTTWITWDTETLYVAAQHPDVSLGGSEHWLLIYAGDVVEGTTLGLAYNTQQPLFSTPVEVQLQYEADGQFNARRAWDGASWSDEWFWLGTDGSRVAELEAEDTIELQIPWSELGITTQGVVYVGWLYEGNGFESTYAGVPSTAFLDGYDPDVSAMIAVDLTGPDSPRAQNP